NDRMPSDLAKLFHWIGSQDVPRLEDECPPDDFYADLLEDKAIELSESQHGFLVVSMGCQTKTEPTTLEESPLPMLAKASQTGFTQPKTKTEPTTLEESPLPMLAKASQTGFSQPVQPITQSWGSLAAKLILALSLIQSVYALAKFSWQSGYFYGFGPMKLEVQEPSSMTESLWRLLNARLAALGQRLI
ncbi:hypothetical protein KR009_006164, partial [Drosophila setifemur]